MRTAIQPRTLVARLLAAALLLASAGSALAAVRYVDVTSTNATPPYTNWATAATNIQDAVDAAVAGDEIVVTNGIYTAGGRATVTDSTTNRVAVDKPLTLRSLNGPEFTTIDGGHSNRCVYLTNGASLSGFTLTNGRAHYGGGLWCDSTNAVVSNCVVSGNSSFAQIIFGQCCFEPAFAGGVYGGTLNTCILSNNRAETYSYFDRRCSYCYFVSGPSEWHVFPGPGGGVGNATLNNCTLTGNSAGYAGGAVSCTLNNCTLTGNSAVDGGGGAWNSTLNNCTLTGNSASYGGGAANCTLKNCTLTGGAASGLGGGAAYSTLNNCVAYFNTCTNGANYDSFSTLNYSCTTPLPTNGVGNITNDPAFVNPAAGNYRLRPDSPCIDAGTNLSASITSDLDGRPRPLDGNGDGLAAFDMGAYEYRMPLLVWQDSPNPTPPHADWLTAAHTIQDAVVVAAAGDEIVVTNGNYSPIYVNKPLNVRSVNGPQSTTIEGGGSGRCVYLTNGASFSGFTLTNGLARLGAGVFCESLTAVVSNCVMSGNRSYDHSANGSAWGGGAYSGTLNNCTLSWNSASADRSYGQAYGGGACECILNNCTLTGNSVFGMGSSGGAGGGAIFCTLNNCTLTGNSAGSVSGSPNGGGAAGCTLNNCTLTGNAATRGGGTSGSTLNNCIVYFNAATLDANFFSSTLNYSCTTPQPTNGVGNVTNAPLFVDQASGNLRLQSNSPCINAGRNVFAPDGSDLDGLPRIKDGTVDIGAYEFQSPASKISYAWLQRFNLPINALTDTADPDGDGVNNYGEWLAGSDPTNPFSFPPLLTLIPYGVPPSGIILTWPTNAFGFTLQSTTNLGSPSVWSTNSPAPVVIGGQNVITNPIAGPQQFYRLVQ